MKSIKERAQEVLADGLDLNKVLHRKILEAWRANSPKMVKRLEAEGILEETAIVRQAETWKATDRYEAAGMPPTDAREQAEIEHLMLEPETDDETDEQ